MSFGRAVAVFLALLFLSCECPSQTQARNSQRRNSRAADVDVIRRIDAIANFALKSVPLAGMSVTVERGSRTIMSKGYGVADVTRGVAAAADTPYRIASITKLFTAVAVMSLIEKGQLRLDDTVDRFFPEHHALKEITIRQLLNHTSAVRDYERDAVARWTRTGCRSLKNTS